MTSPVTITDAMEMAFGRAKELTDGQGGFVGYGIVEVRDERGRLKSLTPFANLITDVGDLYYAGQAIKGVSPANPTAPATLVARMKLGTGSTAVAKSGAGAGIVTYLSGSNVVFDATYPQTANLGAGLGVNAVYKTTWVAGVATNAAITEVVITDLTTDATSTATNCISRAVFTATPKGALDSLAITWNHKFLGA